MGSEMIDVFSSRIITVQMKTAFMGARLNVMTHALCADEGPLPQGYTNAYTKIYNGSKDVALVMRNSTMYPQTLKKKVPVVRMVTANWVLEQQMWPSMIDMLDETQGIQPQKVTIEQRWRKLFEELELASWSLELAESSHMLLAEYHDIFSSEPCELSCTHLTEHVIKVTDDTPFKEQSRQIPLPLVEEVHAHL